MRPFLRGLLQRLGSPGGRESANLRAVRHVVASCRALLSERGDVSGVRLATEVLTAYRALPPSARDLFFDVLVNDFSADPATVERAIDVYQKNRSASALRHLQTALEPPRQELFRRLNVAPGGIGALIEMRRHLLGMLQDHPEREVVDQDLAHLFKSWFNGGFLRLQQIDWRTSAVILERLIQYEAVHEIHGWRDLRRRLEADRGCYALFHPALPEEPLIFIEVALTRGISAKVQPLLDADSVVVDPAVADSAIFYSITNCQDGLRGISFGHLLIKHVIEDLRKRLPRLRRFATLSPMSEFRNWLVALGESETRTRLSSPLMALLGRPDEDPALETMTTSSPLRQEISSLCAYLPAAREAREGPSRLGRPFSSRQRRLARAPQLAG